MRDALGVSSNAAECMLSHGQVDLDGRTLGMTDRTCVLSELQGKMLTAGRLQARLFGSRRIDDIDPRKLPHIEQGNSQLALGEL